MRNFNEKKNRGAQSWGPAMIRGARPSEGELRRGEAATWGRPPAPERPRMRLVSWKPLIKGALRGFATLELPIGLKLIDEWVVLQHISSVSVHQKQRRFGAACANRHER